MDVEALALKKVAVPQAATSRSKHPIAPPVKDAAIPALADVSAPL